jgi:SpoVK/Ycf46/Vps4 family AAA+-type ATPase
MIFEFEEKINLIYEHVRENNVFLPLLYLQNVFELNQFEKNLLLLCLASEIDNDFERLIGYLEDNINCRFPTLSLALKLFCDNESERVSARNIFNTSPLFNFNIIKYIDEKGSKLSRQLKIDERIINYLLESTTLYHSFNENMMIIQPIAKNECLHRKELKKLINLLKSMLSNKELNKNQLFINLYGLQGSGKKTIAATACEEFGFPLIMLDITNILNQPAEKIVISLSNFLRELYLQSALPYFEITQIPDEKKSNFEIFEQFLNKIELPFIIGTEKPWNSSKISNQKTQITIKIPIIEYETRFKLWYDMINKPKLKNDIKQLASTFQFTPGDIIKCVETAKGTARLRDKDNSSLQKEDIWMAARNLPRHKLGELTQKINPIFTWDDIVLPIDIKKHLKELCQQVENQNKVYNEWGVSKKLSRGLGLTVLFSGSSGTGKTMAAEVIANELNLDLYRIDLSSIVNKYIGETEKNLRKVFDEAEKSHAILFFDEADALFGKRTEIKDSHDRYANIEINYLLQKMEEYKGLCILATNMKKAIDKAFTRRIRIVIEFPIPNLNQRKEIWKKGFEPNIPYNGIDFDFLATQFKITGGNIRNITLNAAFLAAAENKNVYMSHLINATKREFNKIGKLCLESEFEKYYSIIK